MNKVFCGLALLLAGASYANPVQVKGEVTLSYDRPRISAITFSGAVARALYQNLDVAETPAAGFEGLKNSEKSGPHLKCSKTERSEWVRGPGSDPRVVTTYRCTMTISPKGAALEQGD